MAPRRRRGQAKELTDALAAPDYAMLTDAEASELIALLDKACAITFG
jgi:hypothetical protein